MKNLINTVALVFLSYSLLTAQQTWKPFTPKGENFEILAPGEMKSGKKKLLTDVGELQPVTWLYEGTGDDKNHLYMVSYVDYPSGTFPKDSVDLITEFLTVSLETHLLDLKGVLSYKSDAPYGMNPGIIYRVSYNENKHVVKSRMLLLGDRFYAIQVYTTSENSLNGDINRFLESFRAKL